MINLQDCQLTRYWRPNPQDLVHNELIVVLSWRGGFHVRRHITDTPNNLESVIETNKKILVEEEFERLRFEVTEFSKQG